MAIRVANNQSLTAITALPSAVSGGAMTLLETQTASGSATISFTSNIDSTYDEYVFKFYDIYASSDDNRFTFQGSIDSGSNYNVAITSAGFQAYHTEGDSSSLEYSSSLDSAQGTGFLPLNASIGASADESSAGTLRLFSPSSTTFVKHFIAENNAYLESNGTDIFYTTGYFNTTSAINGIQFKMLNNNIDSGVIKLYGIS
jgi:hypothetical protein